MSDRSPERAVRLDIRDGVAVLTIDNPPVNAFAHSVMQGLAQRLDAVAADAGVRAVVVTGAGGNFIAGADITRLERIAAGQAPATDGPSLPELIARLESGPKPSVAAIDGFALGGGLELALGCNARVGTPKCRVGLPELMLGLIPGAGGTQRLPRLIGVAKASDLMLSSRQVRAAEALELGILDAIAEPEGLVDTAIELALELANGSRPRLATLGRSDRIESPEAAREAIQAARAGAKKKARNVTHPDACLDAILEGALNGPDAGLAKERELFLELLESEGARGLIHVFFATRAAAKVPGVTDQGLTPRPITKLGVLGGGTMGSGIATALLSAGLEVTLKEVTDELSSQAVARVARNVHRNAEKGRITPQQAEQMLARLHGQTSYAGFDELHMVIEAATEKVALKQQLFAELERHTRPECILATNTSTIDIDVVGKHLADRSRLLGTHFFSPAHVMKLLEVVRTDSTSPQALLSVLELAKKIRKTAVTVGNCTGFLINRVFMPYGQAAGFLIDRGVHPYRVDRALYDFGMPMGPNRMGDLAGIDVSVFAGQIMDAAYADRAYRSKLRGLLADAGRLGEKTGAGHYLHVDGKAQEDPELDELVERARALAGNPEPIDPSDDEIVRMLVFGIVNESCRALSEGVVIRASDIDVAAILGMGFPAYRGGPMKWADGIGAKTVHDSLAGWHQRFGLELFRPSEYLATRAEAGASLL